MAINPTQLKTYTVRLDVVVEATDEDHAIRIALHPYGQSPHSVYVTVVAVDDADEEEGGAA